MAQGTEREWLPPERISDRSEGVRPGAAAAGGVSGMPAMFELRPLSLGEVLDRTFALYRSHFWLFASISAVSASVQVVVQAISLTAAHALLVDLALNGPVAMQKPMPMRGFAAAQVETWAAGLVFFLVSAITQAATSLAMSEVYLSRPATAKQALGAAVRRWARWIGIALWQIGSMIWLPLLAFIPGMLLMAFGARGGRTSLTVIGGVLVVAALFGGFVAGFIFYLRNTLAVPAAVVERLGIRAAMRRSKVLAAGTKGRIFTVLLIAGCLYGVVGVLESPATLLILLAPKQQHHLAQAITLLVSFAGRTVVAPVALIGLTLVYFDQRVRKEAFDLELLLAGDRAIGAGADGVPRAATSEGLPPLG